MSKKAKLLTGVLSVAAVLLVAFAYYYVVLPPINIHAPGFWIFVIVLAAVFTIVSIGRINVEQSIAQESGISTLAPPRKGSCLLYTSNT